jgi:hypothetical protein
MCFGNAQTSTQTTTPSTAVTSAANSNLGFVNQLQSNGFQPYTGQQVANLAPAQQATINATQNIANNGTGAQASNLIGGYASAPAQSVQANSISSNMSPYMNQYVMQALAPQLQQMRTANAATNQATDAQATGSGAYGDARTGINQANNSFNQNVAQEGLIGSAYNSAFNTAIGAGAQDSANQLSAANANAGYNETALSRSLGGAQALEGLQTQQQGVQTTANTAAQQDTAQQQAQLTAQYNQWLMAQQYPFQTSGLADSAIQAANPANPTTTSLTQPDNSGYAILGTALGVAGGAALNGKLAVSDRRLKEEIELIGSMKDGTPLYSYAYKFDPSKHRFIGPMAQDVKKRRPDAVVELDDDDGTMLVNYSLATEKSRLMSIAI